MACTGIEFCKLAIVETKAQAARVVDELETRLGDLDTPITVHLNGCPNSCARIQVADIGLKGQLVLGPERRPGRGLPGAPGRRARPGRRVRPQAARPQGHRRRAARLRRAGGPGVRRRPRPTASGSPSGWRGPTRRCWYERADARERRARDRRDMPTTGRRSCTARTAPRRPCSRSRAAAGTCRSCLLRVLREETLFPARARLGVPQLPAGVLRDVPRPWHVTTRQHAR